MSDLLIVSLALEDGYYQGYAEDDEFYFAFEYSVKDKQLNKGITFDKSVYSYDMLTAVVGKFDPYVAFFKKGHPVVGLTGSELGRVFEGGESK